MCPTCGSHFRKVRIFLDDEAKDLCADPWHEVKQIRRRLGG